MKLPKMFALFSTLTLVWFVSSGQTTNKQARSWRQILKVDGNSLLLINTGAQSGEEPKLAKVLIDGNTAVAYGQRPLSKNDLKAGMIVSLGLDGNTVRSIEVGPLLEVVGEILKVEEANLVIRFDPAFTYVPRPVPLSDITIHTDGNTFITLDGKFVKLAAIKGPISGRVSPPIGTATRIAFTSSFVEELKDANLAAKMIEDLNKRRPGASSKPEGNRVSNSPDANFSGWGWDANRAQSR